MSWKRAIIEKNDNKKIITSKVMLMAISKKNIKVKSLLIPKLIDDIDEETGDGYLQMALTATQLIKSALQEKPPWW